MKIIKTICIIIFCFISINNFLKDKKWFRPNTFVPIIYSVILILASFQLYGLYEGTTKSISCILIGVSGFIVGAAISDRYRIKRKQKIIVETKHIDKILFIILVICFLSDIIIGIQRIIAGVELSTIRTEYYSISFAFREYLLTPLPILYLSIVFAKAMNGRVKKWHIFTGILVVLSDIVISASRKSLLVVVAYLLIYISEKKINISRRSKRFSLIGTIALITLVIGISINRGSSGIVKEAYHSLCGCVPLLGKYIEFKGNMTPTIIYSAFHGLFSFPYQILSYFGIMSYPKLYLLSSQYINTQTYLSVSNFHKMCAFVTPFYDLYIDGGYVAIFFGMVFYGIICQSVYREMMKNRNMRNTAIFSILIYGLVNPYAHFMFSSSKYLFAILLIFIFYKGRIISEH